MLAYKYKEITYEYEGTQECQLDPLETKKQGQDVWLLPVQCTFEVPPQSQEGKAIVFENDVWVLKNDYRGKRAYNDKGLLTINYIGDLQGSDKLLTQEQIEGLDNGILVWKDGQIIPKPAPTIPEQVAELEAQVEKLNRKLIRDIRVILNPNASTEEKAQAQIYYNEKMEQIEELIEEINELKN